MVMEGKMSLKEADSLDIDTLLEANAALDIYIERQNKASKKGG